MPAGSSESRDVTALICLRPDRNRAGKWNLAGLFFRPYEKNVMFIFFAKTTTLVEVRIFTFCFVSATSIQSDRHSDTEVKKVTLL